MLRYIPHSEIDTIKWDVCIKNATNSLIYGCSFYLNAMAGQWDALVWNDYEAVMPLVWKKKYSVRYLYQPAFTQQLGVFCNPAVNSDTIAPLFLKEIKSRFRFAEIFVNITCGDQWPNCVLPLHAPYNELQEKYTTDLRKNLKIAGKQQLRYQTDFTATDAIALYRQLYASRMPQVSENDFSAFLTICNYCAKQRMLLVRAVTGTSGELLAIALLLKDEKRLYNIMSSVTTSGRKQSANHWLFDQLINEFAQTGFTLDFEGSVIPGIKKFYENFGSCNEPYYFLRYNKLPWLLRWLKKKSNC